mmetsp:Transcript_16752/g.30053  ORF Transcript_16752/g.30053 Transcript_16752/m.30053 type:complete len:132 (+) Transcript_16752:353-748(+)
MRFASMYIHIRFSPAEANVMTKNTDAFHKPKPSGMRYSTAQILGNAISLPQSILTIKKAIPKAQVAIFFAGGSILSFVMTHRNIINGLVISNRSKEHACHAIGKSGDNPEIANVLRPKTAWSHIGAPKIVK